MPVAATISFVVAVIDSSLDSYKAAFELASAEQDPLASTHPIRLGLALNFSVFYYEIMTDHEKACQLAKQVTGATSS